MCPARSDSELGYDGEYDEPSSMYYFNDNVVIGSDSEDDDDDVLEMRTSSSRSRSNSASSMRKAPITTPLRPGTTTSSRPRPPTVRRHSTDREHVTIAPIAPTILKTGNDGEGDGFGGEDYFFGSHGNGVTGSGREGEGRGHESPVTDNLAAGRKSASAIDHCC